MRLVILAISVKKILTENSAYTSQNVTETNSGNFLKSVPEIQTAKNTTTFDIDTIINNITSQTSQVSNFLFFLFKMESIQIYELHE